jgi:hypothetical protein
MSNFSHLEEEMQVVEPGVTDTPLSQPKSTKTRQGKKPPTDIPTTDELTTGLTLVSNQGIEQGQLLVRQTFEKGMMFGVMSELERIKTGSINSIANLSSLIVSSSHQKQLQLASADPEDDILTFIPQDQWSVGNDE